MVEVDEYDDGRHCDQDDDGYRRNHRSLGPGPTPLYLESGGHGHRFSLDDGDRRSHASSDNRRRRRFQRGHAAGDGVLNVAKSSRRPSQPPLTANNLRALSDVSATRPLAASQSRRDGGLYAEPPPHDMVLSRSARNPFHTLATSAEKSDSPTTAFPSPRASLMVHRPRSDPALSLHRGGSGGVSPSKPIDMNLAYGNIPPDLESRIDLDPEASAVGEPDGLKESQARTLVDRIETLLNEAQCIHHTAASIICHLQGNPEAAAAVALTLAELSALLAKLSPAFLGVVKGGSPAVFALLASPQFLIGTSIVVGVTVIIFGGWKIVKRISEVRAAREEERQAFEMGGLDGALPRQQNTPGFDSGIAVATAGAPPLSSRLSSQGYDEALVLEEELSTIETWRRGIESTYNGGSDIEPWGGSEVDIELISPEAMRSRTGDDDQHTLRSARTAKSHGDMSSRSSHNRHRQKHHRDRSRKGKSTRGTEGPPEVPQRQSSRDFQGVETGDFPRSSHSRRGDKAISESGSTSANRSSQHSGRSRRGGNRAFDNNGPSGPASDAGTAHSRDGKKTNSGSNMLKQLFKKRRDKDDKDRKGVAVSALV